MCDKYSIVAEYILQHLNPLKLKLIETILRNVVYTSKKTQLITVTKNNLLMLFKEVIVAYSERCVESRNTFHGKVQIM
jgi:hypothetical protein